MPSSAYSPDFYYELVSDGVLIYPNPESPAARSFYDREAFSNGGVVRDGALWIEDRNWTDVRCNWLASEGLRVAPRRRTA